MIRTINDVYLDLRAQFRKKGIAGYEVEARELVTFALELDYDQFAAKRSQFIFEKDENGNYVILIIESTEELTMQARMIYRKKICNGIYRDYDFESTKRSLMDGNFGELALLYCEQSEIIRQTMR